MEKSWLPISNNEKIPEGWAIDSEGKPTTDPKKALEGAMLPIGDAKGSALALMVEILAAGLTGSNFGFEASSFLNAEGDSPGLVSLSLQLTLAFSLVINFQKERKPLLILFLSSHQQDSQEIKG